MSLPIHLLSQQYNYMFYLGLLVPSCTQMEGPRSPRSVELFTLNYRVFHPFIGDCRPSSRTIVPRPGPSMFPSYEASLRYSPTINETSGTFQVFGLFLAWLICRQFGKPSTIQKPLRWCRPLQDMFWSVPIT